MAKSIWTHVLIVDFKYFIMVFNKKYIAMQSPQTHTGSWMGGTEEHRDFKHGTVIWGQVSTRFWNKSIYEQRQLSYNGKHPNLQSGSNQCWRLWWVSSVAKLAIVF